MALAASRNRFDAFKKLYLKVNNPAASNRASSLQRSRAAGYVTLAAFANMLKPTSGWL